MGIDLVLGRMQFVPKRMDLALEKIDLVLVGIDLLLWRMCFVLERMHQALQKIDLSASVN